MSRTIRRVFRKGKCVRWEILAYRIGEILLLQALFVAQSLQNDTPLPPNNFLFWSTLVAMIGVVRGFFSEFRNDAELRLERINRRRFGKSRFEEIPSDPPGSTGDTR